MKPVKSSSISHVGHDPETNVLSVKFNAGGRHLLARPRRLCRYPHITPQAMAQVTEDADMSEMIERVARILCRQYEIDDGFSPEQADRAAASEMHRNFLKAARAAIETMREPTRAMIDAVDISVPTEGMITDIWDTMIEAALK